MSNINENKNTFHFVVCNNCKNRISGLKCRAFETIPDAILSGDSDHSKPLPTQDNDIVFESK